MYKSGFHKKKLKMSFISSSSDTEEFETPQFKQAFVNSQIKKEQLKPMRPSFCIPPRTESGSLTSAIQSRPASPFTMPKRSMSLVEFELALPEPETKKSQEIDPSVYREKLAHLSPEVPQYVSDALEKIIEKKNIQLVKTLENQIFMFISAILLSNTSKRVLVIVPSGSITKMVRRFLSGSSALWPEGKKEQQNALNKIRNGLTQVLISYTKGVASLQLSHFDYIYVIKSELCTSCFPHLKSFKGQLIFHQTPGYFMEFPVPCDMICPENLHDIASVNIVDCGADPLKKISQFLDDATELTTIIISPYKNTANEAIKKSMGKAVAFDSNTEPQPGKAYSSTTACYYSPYSFEHYIFVGFPATLDHFLSACLVGRRVSILMSNALALKQQSMSHKIGVDQGPINTILSSIFWNGSRFRKNGELSSFHKMELDISQESLELLLQKLVALNYIEMVPFEPATAQVKVLSILDQMNISPVFKAILQGSANRRGTYTVNILQLCTSQNVMPVDIESELQKYVALKALDVKYEGSAIYTKTLVDMNDDLFAELQISIANEMSMYEMEAHQAYNIAYTLMNKPEFIGDYAIQRKAFVFPEIMEIPHAPVDETIIRNFLNTYKNTKFTPRAVARILQGVASPLYEASEWGRSSSWSALASSSFTDIVPIVQKIMRDNLLRK